MEASINTEGFERGEVSFQCSHSFAMKNHKYFCKDPCTANTDILATVKSGERVKSERIILVDLGNGVFTVTFSQLQLSDSGRYWCAVDRPGFDTFTAVYLTVKEGTCMIFLLLPCTDYFCFVCSYEYTFPQQLGKYLSTFTQTLHF